MKKVFLIMIAFMLVLSTTVVAYAEDATETTDTEAVTVETTEAETTEEVMNEETEEDETVTEAAGAVTEATETEVEETTTEAATEAETETSELAGLLDVATPEQVENIRKYLEYGVSSLPVSEKVKMILLDYIDEASWILMAIAFVVFCIVNRLTSKKSDDNAQAMTDNAIEIAEEGSKRIKTAKEAMEKIEQEILARLEDSGVQTEQMAENVVNTVLKIANEVLAKADEMNKHAEEKMEEVSRRESGLTEVVSMLCNVMGFMVDHSSSLPEWERDKMTAIINQGMAMIKEVTTRDESHEE